jgi:hypothetical protein
MSASTEWAARKQDERIKLPEGVRAVRDERGRIDVLVDNNTNTVWQVTRLPRGHASGFIELHGSIKSAVLARHGSKLASAS